MVNQKIRIRLKAYDHRLLDQSTTEIVDTARRTGARVAGPIPLPTVRNRWTVLPALTINRIPKFNDTFSGHVGKAYYETKYRIRLEDFNLGGMGHQLAATYYHNGGQIPPDAYRAFYSIPVFTKSQATLYAQYDIFPDERSFTAEFNRNFITPVTRYGYGLVSSISSVYGDILHDTLRSYTKPVKVSINDAWVGNVGMIPVSDHHAVLTDSAGLFRRSIFAAQRLGQNARHAGLANPARAGEQIGMGHTIRANRIRQRATDDSLARDLTKGLRAIFSGNDEVVHGGGWWTSFEVGKPSCKVCSHPCDSLRSCLETEE